MSSAWWGLTRIKNTQCLTHNGLIPPLLGMTDFPHRDALRVCLVPFDGNFFRSLETAHDKVRAELFQRLGLLYNAIVDTDTAALMTYGPQEGANSNPRNPSPCVRSGRIALLQLALEC